MLAPSPTARTPFSTSRCASRPVSSFWVAHGSATWHGTSHTARAGHEPGPAAAASAYSESEPRSASLICLSSDTSMPVRVVDVAGGVRAGHDVAAELLHLLDRVDGDVAGARDDDGPAVERVAAAASISCTK